MIVDCHTHVWTDEHLSPDFIGEQSGIIGPKDETYSLVVDLDAHYKTFSGIDRVVVLGFQSQHLHVHVPNDYVAAYTARDPHKLIGFCSVDPNYPHALEELHRSVRELGLRGLKISPVYQVFHPWDDNVQPLLAAAAELDIPTLWHMGTTVSRLASLDGANPTLLDRVALMHPELRIIIAHFGHPWVGETVGVMRKHPYVYADMSSMYIRPWQFYQSLLMAWEYGVLEKVLFGSDYPFFTPQATIEALREINSLARSWHMPELPAASIDRIVDGNAERMLRL